MPEHRMWPASETRTGSTGIYGRAERADGPDPATLRAAWPRYDDWHREAIATNAAMPPVGPAEPWLSDSYLAKLRRQGLLHALRALGPRDPPVALVPAPHDPEAACEQFEADGFLYYPRGDLLGTKELQMLQRHFAQQEPSSRQRWEAERAVAGAEGLGHTGDRMIHVGDVEDWVPGGLMQRCVGASPLPATLERIFGGPAVCRGAGARILPPERPVPGAGAMGTPQGYVSWHRDWSTRDGEVRGDPRPDLKLFILVQDVAGIDQAPTAIVPGSHLVPFGAGQLQHDVGRLFGGYGYGRGDHQSRMPNALAFVAPAGSALLMDTRTWCARTVPVLHPFPLQTDASAVRIPWWACIGTLRTQICRTRTAGMSSRCFNQRRRTILRSPTGPPRRRPRPSCERGDLDHRLCQPNGLLQQHELAGWLLRATRTSVWYAVRTPPNASWYLCQHINVPHMMLATQEGAYTCMRVPAVHDPYLAPYHGNKLGRLLAVARATNRRIRDFAPRWVPALKRHSRTAAAPVLLPRAWVEVH